MVRGTRSPWRKYTAVKLGHQIAIYNIPHTCDPIPIVKKEKMYSCSGISENDGNENGRYLVMVVAVVVVVAPMRYEF